MKNKQTKRLKEIPGRIYSFSEVQKFNLLTRETWRKSKLLNSETSKVWGNAGF